jgi:V/A-type H+-transporting ATPase subunit D
MLKEALILPKKEGKLDVSYRNVMSVTVPIFSLQVLSEGGADGYNYGMAFTSGELDAAARELNDILADMVKLAEMEKTAQMLAEEIEKTRRRVNALEYIMMPRYLETIKTIKMKLEENERGNTTRLMKVKDMMLAAQAQQMAQAADDEA